MTAEEIRRLGPSIGELPKMPLHDVLLREIAAQLAELNLHLMKSANVSVFERVFGK